LAVVAEDSAFELMFSVQAVLDNLLLILGAQASQTIDGPLSPLLKIAVDVPKLMEEYPCRKVINEATD